MMRYFTAILLCIMLVCGCMGPACAEDKPGIGLQQDEWTWTAGEVATFKGTVPAAGLDPEDTSLCISVKTVPEQDEPGKCVFTSLNGKRIKIRNQSATVSLTGTAGLDEISFEGSWFIPEDGQFKQVTLTLVVMKTSTGETLDSVSLSCENGEWYEGGSGQPFRLPVDLNQLCWILGAACIVLWGTAILRSVLIRRKKPSAEKE